MIDGPSGGPVLLGCVLLATVLVAAGASGPPTQEIWVWQLPEGVPAPRVPVDNPMSQARVELGRHLFYDKRLSGNGRLSCAGCHGQAMAFADVLPRAVDGWGDDVRGFFAGQLNDPLAKICFHRFKA